MGYFSVQQLVNVMIDLWAAGFETTVTTMGWAILLMMKHPHVQTKVQKELDTVLGSEKEPSTGDKNQLPYTNAVLMEVQRYANIAAGNFGRRITKDIEIDGRVYHEGMTFIPLISVVMMNDKVFENPKEFRPERFLTPDGALKKCDELVPFSLGKRSCLGESLARLELFLLFASLMQKFCFSVDPNDVEPNLEPVMKFTVSTKPYQCLVTLRV